MTMNKFAKVGYFMIKLLTEHEIDQSVAVNHKFGSYQILDRCTETRIVLN